MDFGKVEAPDLNKINFKLPPDHPGTVKVLAKSPKTKTTDFYVGCAKWGRPDWVGKIYPAKTKAADFLEHYAKKFNSIELNATFYRMPYEKQIKGWKDKVGKDFKFCPKFVDQITHLRRLKNTKELVDEFAAVRSATEFLFKSFTEEALATSGISNNNPATVISFGFITLGHFYHHKNVLQERYLS